MIDLTYSPVNIQRFGSLDSDLSLLIWCPHDGDDQFFFKEYPDILDLLIEQHSYCLIEQYLAIERDFGSLAMAVEIANKFCNSMPELSVLVISANIPRGIVDPARLIGRARRNIFFEDVSNINQKLIELHRDCHEQLMHYLEKLSADSIFIDLHTMAPCNPQFTPTSTTEYIIETPKTLKNYINYYGPEFFDSKRSIDLITCDQNNRTLADTVITNAFSNCFLKNGIPFDYNLPYTTSDHLIASFIMQHYRGITIDIPKDLLINESIYDKEFNLAKISLNHCKVEHLAILFSNAIIDSLKIKECN